MTVRTDSTPPIRIIFMGSPEFAVPSLSGLTGAGFDVVLVVTQPDRPAGRGQRVRRPAVAQAADRTGLPVYQPSTLRSSESRAPIEAAKPDLIVVAAFGLLLPQAVLDLPARGCLNVHASLLPRHRGAAPVQAAILAGDAETGITIMRMDAGMDTGDILTQRSLPIGPRETATQLEPQLASLGSDLLLDTLGPWLAGGLQPQPQDEERATYAPRIKRADARLNWSQPAIVCDRLVRAYRGWPNAFTSWQGRNLLILDAQPLPDHAVTVSPGTILAERGAGWSPAVATGEGLLKLLSVQIEGKRPVTGLELVNGYPAIVGATLGD